MGLFRCAGPEASLRFLAGLGGLTREFGLAVLVSVSRKSFLRAVTGRPTASEAVPATLAAELYAAAVGADFIRTHDPAALRDGLKIVSALQAAALTY
jgi:dihydropteroate synthase type 2